MKRIIEDKAVLIISQDELISALKIQYGIDIHNVHNIHWNSEKQTLTIIVIRSVEDEIYPKTES